MRCYEQPATTAITPVMAAPITLSGVNLLPATRSRSIRDPARWVRFLAPRPCGCAVDNCTPSGEAGAPRTNHTVAARTLHSPRESPRGPRTSLLGLSPLGLLSEPWLSGCQVLSGDLSGCRAAVRHCQVPLSDQLSGAVSAVGCCRVHV